MWTLREFYQYACGGWMTANPLPGDTRWGRFDALQDRNRLLLNNVLKGRGRTSQPQRHGPEDRRFLCRLYG
jgi:predicted metalloendopeptidase